MRGALIRSDLGATEDAASRRPAPNSDLAFLSLGALTLLS